MKRIMFQAILPCLFAATSGQALADSMEEQVGRAMYMENCAVCHGESGKGDGYLSGFLNLGVPGLTTISADNDGVFPLLEVIHIVDGRTGVRGHGGDMPLWGERFKRDLIGIAGEYGAETIVRGRVLSLAYYLESIQE